VGVEGEKVRLLPLISALAAVACGGDPGAPAMGAAGGNAAGMSAGGSDAGSPTAGSVSASGSVSVSGSGGTGGAVTMAAGPMKLISRGLPVFASSGMASSANDDKPNIAWSSESLPAWLAYDVSSVPAADRKQVLLAWYCYFADYMVAEAKPEQQLPIDYLVEINAAPSAASPPAEGWTEVARVTANARSARQHVFDLSAGGNWVRLNVSKSSNAAQVMVDVDLYSAPAGGSDGWLFMGDSITYMTTQRAFSDLPDLVSKAAPGRVALVLDCALGGTNTTTAQ
jgi:hypothetical protein